MTREISATADRPTARSRPEKEPIASSHEGMFHNPPVYQLAEKLKNFLG